ncbi:MAG: NAD(P)(+) transhydrogenase (Re/Si-specific) subunit beta [Planctomycetes bacterium]|nr:NAD(P)(+) transhydrogenase (Re/Si-specific) subunit beta [Planctomycetota bacterium]
MSKELIDLAYLIAAMLFIMALKGLSHPRHAVRGNFCGATGMLVATIAVMLEGKLDFTWIIVGMVIGTAAGVWYAVQTKMTSMPQLVALLNGYGGGSSLLVAGVELTMHAQNSMGLIATAASGLIGAVTFSGSFVAYAKLEEMKIARDLRLPGQQALNGLLVALCLVSSVCLFYRPEWIALYWLIVLLGLVLGFFLVIGIGGADMPVVISLLNSYSGMAAAATGFVLQNNVLIIGGALVGASGIILTRIMCVAMNRSLTNVLFGAGGGGGAAMSKQEVDAVYATVKSTSAEEVAMLLEVASRVVIIPGYGMAVSQAQHAVSDLTEALMSKQITVEFGIHPVAGRMPGHMNVLLAEADIPYELLKEMDDINATMEQCDVAIVLGANDVVNPVARESSNSPIAGMPIINVDKARTVIIIKRSLSPGFAGIPNPLFAAENALMLYGDGRHAVVEILNALQGK